MTRRNEIDALRGILLLLMALTHLPTGLNPYANQPLGFVSAAEGFVFLSAFLVGSIYTPQLRERGIGVVRARIWKRARRLYLYHLGLLVFAFTVVAGVAHLAHSEALHNFLAVFFRAPGRASLAAPLLLYQPPLMDILPMYIVFLALTPVLLGFAARRGWWPLLALSALIWMAAQLRVGQWLYGAVAAWGYPLPSDAWSSFDWFAWQLVWVAGLWLGSGRGLLSSSFAARAPGAAVPAPRPSVWRQRGSTYALLAAVGLVAVLLCARHHFGGFMAQLDVNSSLVSKWHLGPLRLANFALLGFVAHRILLPALHWLRIAVLELLGRGSLQVFTAHIPVCILADGLLGSAPIGLHFQVALLTLLLGVMLLVAWKADAPRRAALARGSAAEGAPAREGTALAAVPQRTPAVSAAAPD